MRWKNKQGNVDGSRQTGIVRCGRLLPVLVGVAILSAACTISVPDISAGDGTGSGGGDGTVTIPPIGADDNNTGDNNTGDTGGGDNGAGGSGDDGGATGSTTTPAPTQDPQVGQVIQSFGNWQAKDVPPFADDRNLTTDTFEAPNRVVVTCAPALESRTFQPGVFKDFAAFPFSGDIRPGLIVEGAGIEDGDLRVLPLARNPIPLVVDLASEKPSVVVEDPTPSNLQTGVSALMRAADERISGLAVVPANIRFSQTTVSSYEEAVLSMGVSLRYDSPDLQAEFKSAFEQRTGSERHSVMVRLLQPMFTIKTDQSAISGPGDFFSPTVSMNDLGNLEGQNRLGQDNPPVLIDAVTYGRVVYMTVTSSTVTSSDELLVAVSGAYNGFSGDASIEEKNSRIVSESEIQIEAYGGDDDIALNALKSGQIQDFMESVNTSTAAPLSMVFRTLDGTKLSVTDEATITDIGCTRRTKPNEIGLQLDVGNSTWVTVKVNGAELATYKANTSQFINLTSKLRTTGNNRVELVYQPPTCIGGSMTNSFRVNGTAYKGKEWRIAGHAGEWACTETGTWNIDAANGTVVLASGPPALRETT